MKSKINKTISKLTNKKILPYLLILPSLLIVLGLLIYPLSYVFRLSLQSYNPTKPWGDAFVGFNNFIELFTDDDVFFKSLVVSVKWVFSQVTLQLFFGLSLAILLNKKFKGRGLIRAGIFAPWAISGVIVAIIWSLIYNEHIGLLNDILIRLGFIKNNIAWLSNTNTALGATIIAELWRGIPFFAISLLSSLQSIPNEIIESSKLDGASAFQRFIYITIPYLKNTIVITTLLRTVWEFKTVDMILNLTGGGPVRLTTTLSIYLSQQALNTNDFGYGSAIGVLYFIILTIFSLFYLKVSKFGKDE